MLYTAAYVFHKLETYAVNNSFPTNLPKKHLLKNRTAKIFATNEKICIKKLRLQRVKRNQFIDNRKTYVLSLF